MAAVERRNSTKQLQGADRSNVLIDRETCGDLTLSFNVTLWFFDEMQQHKG